MGVFAKCKQIGRSNVNILMRNNSCSMNFTPCNIPIYMLCETRKNLKLMSLHRKREWYSIIQVRNFLNSLAPNYVDLEFKRQGIKAEISPIMKGGQLSVWKDYNNTLGVRAAQLFNVLPPKLRRITTLESFEVGLGWFT